MALLALDVRVEQREHVRARSSGPSAGMTPSVVNIGSVSLIAERVERLVAAGVVGGHLGGDLRGLCVAHPLQRLDEGVGQLLDGVLVAGDVVAVHVQRATTGTAPPSAACEPSSVRMSTSTLPWPRLDQLWRRSGRWSCRRRSRPCCSAAMKVGAGAGLDRGVVDGLARRSCTARYWVRKSVEEPGLVTPSFLPLKSAGEVMLAAFGGDDLDLAGRLGRTGRRSRRTCPWSAGRRCGRRSRRRPRPGRRAVTVSASRARRLAQQLDVRRPASLK